MEADIEAHLTIGSRSRPERPDHCMGSRRSGCTITLADRGRDPVRMTRSDDRSGDDRSPPRGRRDGEPDGRGVMPGVRWRTGARGARVRRPAGGAEFCRRSRCYGRVGMRNRIVIAATGSGRASSRQGDTDRSVAPPSGRRPQVRTVRTCFRRTGYVPARWSGPSREPSRLGRPT
jgi:hypothetical protein